MAAQPTAGWMTACTPGSAPVPTLGNEYGKPLPSKTKFLYSKTKFISTPQQQSKTFGIDIRNSKISVKKAKLLYRMGKSRRHEYHRRVPTPLQPL